MRIRVQKFLEDLLLLLRGVLKLSLEKVNIFLGLLLLITLLDFLLAPFLIYLAHHLQSVTRLEVFDRIFVGLKRRARFLDIYGIFVVKSG